ncbi:MAG: xanthine dehydrogenase family protein molybdopterin-binding subunit [Geminicoccaceae bacterium]|nr:xanthine dehydrogenase family protein molybdopterin-binding subunit [Geminicoccaceae bacterium]
MTTMPLSRRGLIKSTALAGGGFALAFALPLTTRYALAETPPETSRVTAFLEIYPDGTVRFLNPFAEMGQGVYTAIPQVVAEEMDADLARFIVMQAPVAPEYKVLFDGTLRFTGGSTSVRGSFGAMRNAGATARAMLLTAAAERWGVDPSELAVENHVVRHAASDREAGFGDLAQQAAALEPPREVTLKDEKDFRLIGQSPPRTDTPLKVNGTAWFGIDTKVEGMVHAAIRQCPVFEGKVASIDDAAARKLPGVVDVVNLDNAVAALADSWWRAKKAVDAVDITWDEGPLADFSSEGMLNDQMARVDETGVPAEDEGDAPKALRGAETVVEATYVLPFLAHATMEPMNCTADVRADGCDVWAPNQGADSVATLAEQVTGLPHDRIRVHTPYLGGGFGRRFIIDYAAQAMLLSMKAKRPVKLVWSREEDTTHDYYRPQTVVKARGAVKDGRIQATHITVVGDGPLRRHMKQFLADPDLDESVFEGLVTKPYQIEARRTDYVYHEIPVPIGFWRSVGNSVSGYAYESFMDEMAHAAGADPMDFRLAHLGEGSSARGVLEKVRDIAGYKKGIYDADGERRVMGIALHESFGSMVGEIAEVSIEAGAPKVHKVWCAIDVGTVVNPAIVKAQLMSAIAYGLSAALIEEVTLEKGRVQQANFDTYPFLPPDRMPEVVAEVLTLDRPMGGVGEPGTPPIAAAVANAVFQLTGERVRRLPFGRRELKQVEAEGATVKG